MFGREEFLRRQTIDDRVGRIAAELR